MAVDKVFHKLSGLLFFWPTLYF